MSSLSFGSEPGVLSLGSGSLPTEAMMTINCTNRFERKTTIWQIEDEIRQQLSTLRNVKAVDVYDFGATPMSSIKAPVNVRLLAEDYHLLPEAGRLALAAMARLRGSPRSTPVGTGISPKHNWRSMPTVPWHTALRRYR